MLQHCPYDKVREVVGTINESDEARLKDALATLSQLEISGPLQSAVFIKHHLAGEHETSVDRIIADEETGERYAVLSYPEGEVPVKLDKLPRGARAGLALRYRPISGKFVRVGKERKKDGKVRGLTKR